MPTAKTSDKSPTKATTTEKSEVTTTKTSDKATTENIKTTSTPVKEHVQLPEKSNTVLIISISSIVLAFSSLIYWVYYAYRYPNTRSGLFLIQHCRPRHDYFVASYQDNDESGL